jgi:hypothetical protein
MVKWEYKIVYENELTEKKESLDKLGKDGWELMGIKFYTVFKEQNGIYIFKRKQKQRFFKLIIKIFLIFGYIPIPKYSPIIENKYEILKFQFEKNLPKILHYQKEKNDLLRQIMLFEFLEKLLPFIKIEESESESDCNTKINGSIWIVKR